MNIQVVFCIFFVFFLELAIFKFKKLRIKTMKPTPEIQSAFQKCIREYAKKNQGGERGAINWIAEQLSLPKEHANYVSGWKDGKRDLGQKYIEPVLRLLKPYLPENFDIVESVQGGKKISPKEQLQKYTEMSNILEQLSPGHQIITGVLNLSGISEERVRRAIRESDLTETQKQNLIYKIFS